MVSPSEGGPAARPRAAPAAGAPGGHALTIVIIVACLLALAGAIRLLQSGDGPGNWGEALGEFIKPALIPLVQLINQPGFVYSVSALILLSALALIALYLQRVVRPRFHALRRAEFEVKALPRPPGGDWRRACEDIGAVLGRHEVLLRTWPAFAQEAADLGRLPPRRFAFYVEADPTSELNRQGGFMAALPGYYTTVGLIFTFVGLVVALYFAGRGFRSGDMNEARQSIVELLNASSFKFLTSVAALFSAFAISIAHRAAQTRVRGQAWRLLAAIDLHLQAARIAEPTAAEEVDLLAQKLDRVIDELVATREAIEALRLGNRREVA